MSKTIPIHAEPTLEKHTFEVNELSEVQLRSIHEMVSTEHASVVAIFAEEDGKPVIHLNSRERNIPIMTIYNSKERLLPLIELTLRLQYGATIDSTQS